MSPIGRARFCHASRPLEYYGHDAGVCVVDDCIAHEWAFIPHFYRAYMEKLLK